MNANADSYVVDTSILIEFMEGSELGKRFEEQILNSPSLVNLKIPFVVEMELKYILGRRFGYNDAIEKVEKALQSFQVISEERLRNNAVKYKCKYSISIADCYSMALAEIEQIPLYMKKEREVELVKKNPDLDIQIRFLEE
jgi:uncharacterized protein